VIFLPNTIIDPVIKRALAEDLGDAGDITSEAVVAKEAKASAEVVSRKVGTVAGLFVARRVYELLDPAIETKITSSDGSSCEQGDVLIKLQGSARTILMGERVALNFLGHMSGIATATAQIVASVSHTKARVCCTRKTTPGLRAFEKYSVRMGGGINHRFGLHDGILIKDNHIAATRGIEDAVKSAQSVAGHMVKIEVEVDSLDQLEEALTAGADVIMLDNMSTQLMRDAAQIVRGRAILEASGSITTDTAPAIAELGIDVISSGWITHSAPALDVGLDFLC